MEFWWSDDSKITLMFIQANLSIFFSESRLLKNNIMVIDLGYKYTKVYNSEQKDSILDSLIGEIST